MKDIADLIFEAKVQKMSAEEYREELRKNFPKDYPPEIGTLHLGDVYHNPPEKEHTGDREAFGNIPWIEYWRRLTGYDKNHLRCSFCGRDIYIDLKEPDAFLRRMEGLNVPLDYYQAVGGHYHKNKKDKSDGYVIIPVCKGCNGKAEDEELVVKVANKYVEEIGASTKTK